MWIILQRQPRALAHVWPGRTVLAVLDALAWPAAWLGVQLHLPVDAGLIGRVSVALALLWGAHHAWTAVLHNERYHFVTWGLWRLVWPLLSLAIALQAAFWLTRGH